MKALTAAEMREVDRLTTERYGIPSLQLMEAAGNHVAEAVLREFSPRLPQRVAVLCGKGNNGGDGLVAARLLHGKIAHVGVLLFGAAEELRGDAKANFQRWQETGNEITRIESESAWQSAWPEVAAADAIVDALLGTGLHGPATGVIAQAIEAINRLSRNATAPRPALILAVDTPSGLPSDGPAAEGPVLRAHRTVTFTAPKIGQLISTGSSAVGSLKVRSIGSPSVLIEQTGKGQVRWAEPEEFAGLPLLRAADAHKGNFGHILLIGGSLGKSGALVLAGRAALFAGAGLVTLAAPGQVLPAVAASQAEYMTFPLAETEVGTISYENLHAAAFGFMLDDKSVLGVGPGVSVHAETQKFVRELVQWTERPVVLDADGLNAFVFPDKSLRERKTKFLALTPHPGEMARLLGSTSAKVQEDRLNVALEAASRWNAHVVLKGFHTILAGPDGSIFVNTTGNAGLAKGGSGDVLTGILAALTAQFGTEDWLRILALGVYLHGFAAELATEMIDLSGLLAGEVADAVPQARLKLLQELRKGA
jgi:NAD(P)H-hydrate epimerase